MNSTRTRIRSILVAAAIIVTTLVGGAVPAVAGGRVPECTYHFNFIRHGTVVRVTGVELHVFSPAYMVVYAGVINRAVEGPFNASPNSGASFELHTGSTKQTTIIVSLTDPDNTYTYCSSSYNA
jgi:hypothetical protein